MEEYFPDDGSNLSCLVHRTFYTPKISDQVQITNLFRTRGTVKGKVCQIIIDNGSTNNLISERAAKKLELTLEENPKPYKIGWINNGEGVEIKYLCKVPLSIGKRYNDTVTCDVVDMDAIHI